MCWEIIKLLFIWKQKISHSHIAVLQSHISGLPRCKNLWIFSLFRALFVCVLYIVSGLFVVLLVPCFTSLVSFTGFYTEDEPTLQICCLSFFKFIWACCCYHLHHCLLHLFLVSFLFFILLLLQNKYLIFNKLLCTILCFKVNSVNCNTSWKISLFLAYEDNSEEVLKGVSLFFFLRKKNQYISMYYLFDKLISQVSILLNLTCFLSAVFITKCFRDFHDFSSCLSNYFVSLFITSIGAIRLNVNQINFILFCYIWYGMCRIVNWEHCLSWLWFICPF